MAMAALKAAVGTVNRYPDASGTDLKAALAGKWALRPNQIALGNGADEWMLLLCLAFAGPGDEVVMAHGSFISYLLRATEVGAKAVRVPLQEHAHDLEAMAAAISERTHLVFVCNPNNPTGTMVDSGDLAAFVQRVPERILVVVDEAYYEYVSDEHRPRTLEAIRGGQENLIVLRSFSKVYGLAGLRVGYMLAHEKVVDYMERARPPFNVNRLAQVAALAALDDEDHVQRSVQANESAKAFFYARLDALGVRYIPTQTNFVAIDVERPASQVSGPLLARGFLTTALDNWGVPHHLRFSFGTVEENKAFVEALEDVLGGGSHLAGVQDRP
jgi:histidinol-phosphate aminotransferase